MQILFSGCSVVEGVGLPQRTLDPNNFANIIGSVLGGHVNNIAVNGNNNERIFLETAAQMSKSNYDMIVVCWTSYPRHVFWPGLELYECRRSMSACSVPIVEHNGNELSWSSAQFERIRQWFLMLTHDHYSILDICKYVNVLKTLAASQGGRIYFVNTLAAWDYNYFEQFIRLVNVVVKPCMLTDYTNQLLNSSQRDDEQINTLFHNMGQDYAQAGNIKPQHWLNLYQSLHSLQIDKGDDDRHPGPLSHQRYAKLLLENINQNTLYH